MTSLNDLVDQLLTWSDGQDPHVQAAVELLIEHGRWIADRGFRDTCITVDDGIAWIDWDAARAAYDAGRFGAASGSEQAVLDFAISLGEDRYQFYRLDFANRRLVLNAIAHALGIRL